MKRILLLCGFFVLVIVGGLALSGCDLTPPPVSGTVEMLAYGEADEEASLLRSISRFKKDNPGATINYTMYYKDEYHQQVSARIAANDIPDLAYMGSDILWGTPWNEAGQQFDHADWIDTDYYDMDLIPPMGPNGEIYEIPLGTSNITTVLFVNKALVNSLGFEVPTTYEGWVALAPAAREAGLDVWSIDGADGWAWGSCFMSAVIARMSGDPQWVSKAVAGQNKFTDKVFVDSLAIVEKAVADGVISDNAVLVDYGQNIANYANGQALAMIQGQWVAGDIATSSPEVAENTLLLPLPKLPGEKAATAGSVAAAIQVGYGLTKSGASDPAVRDAALKFLRYFYSHPETTQRLLDGAIVAPILKDFVVPAELGTINKQKVQLAQTALNTDVIDAFLAGAANDALNAGMQKIASGASTPQAVAQEVQGLLQN
jgi:raffinose/stachyose/melibiose transport system substrate-binding protein